MLVSRLFLEYRLAKLHARSAILRLPIEFAESIESMYQSYHKDNAHATTWVASLVKPNSIQYKSRDTFALALSAALDAQETELDKRIRAAADSVSLTSAASGAVFAGGPKPKTIGLMDRLRYSFAGLTTLILPGRNVLLALAVALSLILMVMSLAVMAQAGMLIAGSWALGNTLTAAALWLATQLSMTTLGLPGLIVLATVGAWLAATFIVEWKFRGTIENAFFGLADNGSKNTRVYRPEGEIPSLIGVSMMSISEGELMKNPFTWFALPFAFLNKALFFMLAKTGDKRPSSQVAVFIKGVVHFILAALAMPFMALMVISDSFVLALDLIIDITNLASDATSATKGGASAVKAKSVTPDSKSPTPRGSESSTPAAALASSSSYNPANLAHLEVPATTSAELVGEAKQEAPTTSRPECPKDPRSLWIKIKQTGTPSMFKSPELFNLAGKKQQLSVLELNKFEEYQLTEQELRNIKWRNVTTTNAEVFYFYNKTDGSYLTVDGPEDEAAQRPVISSINTPVLKGSA
jgi:hypothetical protein